MILRLRRPQTRSIDARGAAVVPGFNDAHVHPINGGLTLVASTCSATTNVGDISHGSGNGRRQCRSAPWVLGRRMVSDRSPGACRPGSCSTRWSGIARRSILSYDRHTAWVNTRALKLAGITRLTPNPAHGAIVKDPRTASQRV